MYRFSRNVGTSTSWNLLGLYRYRFTFIFTLVVENSLFLLLSSFKQRLEVVDKLSAAEISQYQSKRTLHLALRDLKDMEERTENTSLRTLFPTTYDYNMKF
jgi:hypothetical protein